MVPSNREAIYPVCVCPIIIRVGRPFKNLSDDLTQVESDSRLEPEVGPSPCPSQGTCCRSPPSTFALPQLPTCIAPTLQPACCTACHVRG